MQALAKCIPDTVKDESLYCSCGDKNKNKESELNVFKCRRAKSLFPSHEQISDGVHSQGTPRKGGTWKQQNRKPFVHMPIHISCEFSSRGLLPHRRGSLRHKMRSSFRRHIGSHLGSDEEVPITGSTIVITIERYLLTYTITLAGPNMEFLSFGSTRIAHQDNGGN